MATCIKHVRTHRHGKIHNLGGATIVAKFNKNGDMVECGIAYCCTGDNFNKAIGRQIAEAKIKPVPDSKAVSYQQVVKMVTDEVARRQKRERHKLLHAIDVATQRYHNF